MFGKFMKMFLKVLFFFLLVCLGVSLILFGFYYANLSKKNYPFIRTLDSCSEFLANFLVSDEKYYMSDNFTIEGDAFFDLESEEYSSKSTTDIEYLKKNNVFVNLSKMDTHYVIKHLKDKGQLYLELKQDIGEEEFFNAKYLIDNSTRYYFVNGILANYVNGGGDNYFETITDNNTSMDNVNYLYKFIVKSIEKNIKEEDITGYDTEINYGNGTMKVGAVSLEVDDKYVKELLKSVLKDLKNDEKASQILTTVYHDFNSFKVNNKKRIIGKDENYIINIYVKKQFYVPVKFEVVHINNSSREVYTFEGDLNNGLFYYALDNELKYSAEFKASNKKINVEIFNSSSKSIGTINIDKDSNNLAFLLTLELNNKKYDINYTRKYSDYVENKSYQREDYLSLKIMDEMVNQINGSITFKSSYQVDGSVVEDLSSSVLESTLSEDDKNKFLNVFENVREKLER